MCLGNTGQTPLAQRLMMPGDTFIIFYKAIDGNYCVTLDIRTHPGLQSKKSIIAPIDFASCLSPNSELIILMQVSALQSQNKAKQYKSDEILIKQYTFLQLRMGLCVLKCVKSGTL